MPVPAPNSIPADTTVIDGIVQGLITITMQLEVQPQTFPQVPDGPPPDNSVIYVLKNIACSTPEDGWLRMVFTYEIDHLFRRTRLQDALATATPWILPWIEVLSNLSNTEMGNLTVETYPTNVKLGVFTLASTQFIAITSVVDVVYDQPLSR
jgi:hypothetical protein